MTRIRAAVLGVRDDGAELCAAVAADRAFRLTAVADADAACAAETARRFNTQAYDDYRSAVVSGDADALFVTIPPHERHEYLKLAGARRATVLVTGPPAIDLERAAELARVFAASEATLSVARFWQCEPAYVRLAALEMLAGRVFSADVNILAPLGDLQGWRGDAGRAGGGVLLHDAYDHLDALGSVFGMPEEVYAALPRTSDTGAIRPHDTEDAVSLMLRYPGPRVVTLHCRRFAAKHDWSIRLHGARAAVLLTPERMTIDHAGGGPPSVSSVRPRLRFASVVAAFGAAVECGLARTHSPISAHLPTMAVIQAAYLAARTGQPESPRRVFLMATGEEVA